LKKGLWRSVPAGTTKWHHHAGDAATPASRAISKNFFARNT